ncbi:MAG: NusG domain II-containing protein [Clostridia bacterium]|nr:NusG domain II-containing protein [Clostridia bacterium]
MKKYRWDILVIALLLLVSVSLVLILNLTKTDGRFVVVEIDGKVSSEYPLSQNGTFPLNGGTNTLVIEDGKAYLINSSCPDHTCERTGKIHYVGQSIVCLPNRLSVTVRGESDESGPDLIS